MRFLLLLALVPLLATPAFAQESEVTRPTDGGTLDVKLSYGEMVPGQQTRLGIDFINPQTQMVQEHIDYTVTVSKGNQAIFGPIPLTHTSEGSVRIPVEFVEEGAHDVYVQVEGILFLPIPEEAVTFGIMVGQTEIPDLGVNGDDGGGGCLIATAAYGSELAPQVQRLRELRDGTILMTESGTAFMTAFNEIYYSFSPSIADFEREHPAFKEATKIALVPLLSSLSILDYAGIDSEHEMLVYGMAVVMLNVGMYVGIPAVGVVKLCRSRRR